ncbi:MAG: GAF domain-containing protein, partial [Nitrospiraceae bacterium]|nr:GAF domain-containing protein [Nitrospiraceae bacterium]
VWVSENIHSLLGYSVEEATRPGWWRENLYPEDRERAVKEFSTLFEKGTLTHEYRFLREDGSVVWIEDTMHFLGREHDLPYQIVGSWTDVSIRKQIEKTAHLEGRRYQALIEHGLEGILILDKAGTIVYSSPAISSLLGYSESDIVGRRVFEFVHPEDFSRPREKFEKVVKDSGKRSIHQGRFRTRDGGWRWIEASAANLMDDPAVHGMVVNFRDITKRKKAEEDISRQMKVRTALYDVAEELPGSLDTEAVAQEVVRVSVETFGARLAWIGRAREDGSVRVVAQCPRRHPYPQRITVRWDDSLQGQGPTGQAIRTGEPRFVEDISTDVSFAPWLGEATPYKFVSSAAFPLISQGHTFGTLNLYSDEHGFFTSELKAAFQMLASLGATALEKARLYEEARLRVRETEIAGKIFQRLNAEPDVPQNLSPLTEELRSLTNSDRLTIALIDREGRKFTILAADALQGKPEKGATMEISSTAAAEDVLAGRAHLTPDLAAETGFAAEQMLYQAGYRSRINLPLIKRGEVIGALNFTWRKTSGYALSQIPLLQQVADAIALALDRSWLFSTEQKRSREMETLLVLSTALRNVHTPDDLLSTLLKQLRSAFAVDGAQAILLDRRKEHFTVAMADGILEVNVGQTMGVDEGIRGAVLRTRRPYVTPDYATDPRRIMGLIHDEIVGPAVSVPLQSEEELLGVLMIARQRNPHAQLFTQDDVRLLGIIGEVAASTLRRMRLYNDAQYRLKQVQALRAIDMAITASLDPRVTLRVLLDEVTTQLNVDAASVLLLNPYTQELTYSAGRGFRSSSVKRTRVRLGEGYAGQAALERQVLVVENTEEAGDFVRGRLLQEEGFLAYSAAPMVSKGRVLGVLEIFHRTPMSVRGGEWMEFLEALAGQAAIAIDNSRLFYDLEMANTRLRQAYDATIEGWSRALDLRDHETENHTQRVTELTLKLARAAGMSEEEQMHVRRGALLHDIGKMGVPDYILLKPGGLTEEEREIMKQHPVFAHKLLSPIEYLRPALDIPYCHHERWDGSGYPRGLKGEEIPLAARLFAVADVWDALTSDRPYREAWSEAKALEYIRSQSGRYFDPKAVDLFLKVMNDPDSY